MCVELCDFICYIHVGMINTCQHCPFYHFEVFHTEIRKYFGAQRVDAQYRKGCVQMKTKNIPRKNFVFSKPHMKRLKWLISWSGIELGTARKNFIRVSLRRTVQRDLNIA